MKWYEKALCVLTLICLLIILIFGLVIYSNEDKSHNKIIGQITDKYSLHGTDRYFIQLEIEVTPEEYIGYDIGDEYSKEVK